MRKKLEPQMRPGSASASQSAGCSTTSSGAITGVCGAGVDVMRRARYGPEPDGDVRESDAQPTFPPASAGRYGRCMATPTLPDGFVVVVKRECETCGLVVPVLAQLARGARRSPSTRRTTRRSPSADARSTTPTSRSSWHHEIETVPTLLRVDDGAEVGRTVGWCRDQWEDAHRRRRARADLPAMRPGCGSLTRRPRPSSTSSAPSTTATCCGRAASTSADAEDEIEAMFERGWTDGLPVVPPTERAGAAHARPAPTRDPQEVVAVVPPDLVDVHGREGRDQRRDGGLPARVPAGGARRGRGGLHRRVQHARPARHDHVRRARWSWCNGPVTRAIGMNSGVNALGQGNRANATIGRALQLVVRNVGGGRPGEVDRATLGNPGKYTFCFAEATTRLAAGSRSPSSRGVAPGDERGHAVRRRRARGASSTSCRATPESLARVVRGVPPGHCPPQARRWRSTPILVLGPEHAPGVPRGGLGPRPDPARAAHRGCTTDRRPSSYAAPAASPRACPTGSPTADAARSSAPAGC